MNEALDLVYQKLSHVAKNGIPLLTKFDGSCDCCGRDASEFGYQAVLDKNGYGESRNLCARCATLFYGDAELMGWERKGKPISFAMMISASAVIPVKGRAILYPPNKTFNKLPSALRNYFDIELIKSPIVRLIHAINNVQPPFIFIMDFGRRGMDLAQNLRITQSLDKIYMCSDTSAMVNDYSTAKKIAQILSQEERETVNKVMNAINQLATGQITPLEIQDLIEKNSVYHKVFTMLPVDPHLKLEISKLTKAILKVEF